MHSHYVISTSMEAKTLTDVLSNEDNDTLALFTRGPPATYASQIAITVAVALMGLWSTVGNIVTIFSILSSHFMRSKCNLFILSLAWSDLISGLIASPLWLYRRTWGFGSWEWGDLTCKLFWFTDESTSYCTALHIASFSVWRFLGVRYPQSYETIPRRSVKIWIGLIWGISIIFGGFLFSSFYEVFDKPQTGEVYSHWPSCSIKVSNNRLQKHLVYYTFSSTLFMIVPMVVLFCMSVLIARELMFREHPKCERRRQRERRAVLQLALISISFLIGYIPMTSYVMWTTRTSSKDAAFDYWFHIASYFSLRFSECLNPIVYNIACEKMRRATSNMIIKLLHLPKRNSFATSTKQMCKAQDSPLLLTSRIPPNSPTSVTNVKDKFSPNQLHVIVPCRLK